MVQKENIRFTRLFTLVAILNLFNLSAQSPEYIATLDSVHISSYFKPIPEKQAKWIRKIEPTFSLEEFNSYDYGELLSYISNDIEVYHLEYDFKFQDSLIKCSGLIILPKTETPKGQFIYCHGTILPQSANTVPSYFKHYKQDTAFQYKNVGYAFLAASMGYITFVPDYIGYGSSKGVMHPYATYAPNGKSIVEMVEASKKWIQERFTTKQEFILMGISEGAAIALGTQKIMEEEHPEYTIKLNALCSGPYDAMASTQWYVTGPKKSNLANYAYAWTSYSIWTLNALPINTLFKKPPKKPEDLLSTKRLLFGPSNIHKIYTAELLEKIETEEASLLALLRQSSAMYFNPRGKVLLYHGVQDELVPFVNSQNAASFYEQVGAPYETHFFPNLGHVSIVQPFIFETFQVLLNL